MKKSHKAASPGLHHYMVKHPTQNVLLSDETYNYSDAQTVAAKLGGIVTNRDFARRRGMLARAA
jgi:hypothetical protein